MRVLVSQELFLSPWEKIWPCLLYRARKRGGRLVAKYIPCRVSVLYIGQKSTPNYVKHTHSADSSVQVSGSHRLFQYSSLSMPLSWVLFRLTHSTNRITTTSGASGDHPVRTHDGTDTSWCTSTSEKWDNEVWYLVLQAPFIWSHAAWYNNIITGFAGDCSPTNYLDRPSGSEGPQVWPLSIAWQD